LPEIFEADLQDNYILTKEEIRVFMFEDEWPESLAEKLKDYMIND